MRGADVRSCAAVQSSGILETCRDGLEVLVDRARRDAEPFGGVALRAALNHDQVEHTALPLAELELVHFMRSSPQLAHERATGDVVAFQDLAHAVGRYSQAIGDLALCGAFAGVGKECGSSTAPASRDRGAEDQQFGTAQSVLWVYGRCPGTSPFQKVFATAY
jgi:hypothetical protein